MLMVCRSKKQLSRLVIAVGRMVKQAFDQVSSWVQLTFEYYSWISREHEKWLLSCRSRVRPWCQHPVKSASKDILEFYRPCSSDSQSCRRSPILILRLASPLKTVDDSYVWLLKFDVDNFTIMSWLHQCCLSMPRTPGILIMVFTDLERLFCCSWAQSWRDSQRNWAWKAWPIQK